MNVSPGAMLCTQCQPGNGPCVPAWRHFGTLTVRAGFGRNETLANDLLVDLSWSRLAVVRAFQKRVELPRLIFQEITRSDVRMTTRGHLDRACGNSARPTKRLADALAEILFCSNKTRTHQHPQ